MPFSHISFRLRSASPPPSTLTRHVHASSSSPFPCYCPRFTPYHATCSISSRIRSGKQKRACFKASTFNAQAYGTRFSSACVRPPCDDSPCIVEATSRISASFRIGFYP
ncbi:hypothetical protein BDN70DRAFT_258681 [Pholiota conissans]|uniref:Uncharacterized protein n=1 Tax=Pholiota conissans TaxID=109636 RepID=A0A9P5YTR9_9AGAR|nr:hypothetical protein BDN70DRAFT_258681 [Pholiota conissans]